MAYRRKYPNLPARGEGQKTDNLVDAIRSLKKNGINEKDLNEVIVNGFLIMLPEGLLFEETEKIVKFALEQENN